MKYFLYVTTFIYWLLTLVFSISAVGALILMYIGNLPEAHGQPAKPEDLEFYTKHIMAVLFSSGMAWLSFKSGKQLFYPIVFLNVGLFGFFVTIQAAFGWYLLLVVTLVPVLIVLYRMYKN